ncbi:2-oxoglutarate dehydrogenase E1 component [Pontibacter sp. G13]|uniref:2-oxoglutarate dehydrogenase E1 component n=1 Tax=Pontibacter sp. G13 TaxID=3074898 RepID=UPI00288AFBBC|nr:2-oxoglutarate dehydrogenase E1 component [Pontibacter sp. G13]WNJ21291.1 2-oxoglutarate dehydrogenase E1 component [Pontibacter sp. G13]
MSDHFSFLSNATPEYIDNVYRAWQQDPESVGPEWRSFFSGFEFALAKYGDSTESSAPAGNDTVASKEILVLNLINDYRKRGHLFTKTNPVRERRKYTPNLDLANYQLSDADLDTVFQAGKEVGLGPAKLRDILDMLKQTYCQAIGSEYVYVRKPEMVAWLQQKIEQNRNTPNFSIEKKRHILAKLNEAVIFEKFLGTKFVGQKRFSLEGAETLIPALDAVIEKGADLGIAEFIIGMAHRGRLNVLANTLKKEYDEIFSEFEGKEYAEGVFQGDVKYHLGFSADIETSSNRKVHLSLMPNPSHLEAVDPVVQGAARAKIDRKYNSDFSKLAPILIHGDAAIAAQGVVYEVIQMSLLPGYKAGGTIHLVINNQVGFTTNYIDGRSSTYCTDIAKVTQSPVFHVNGDDAEAVVYAIELAMEFRQQFNRDVFIDLLSYRRHGHNEADEPAFTQPLLYKTIKKHKDPRQIYFDRLLNSGDVEANMAKELELEFKKKLQAELEESRAKDKLEFAPYLKDTWSGIRRVSNEDFEGLSPVTGVSSKKLAAIGKKLHDIPETFKAHKKIRKLFGDRLTFLDEDRLDWALGELLAYGSLLLEGYPIRLSGQDVRRGTFSHRHAVIVSEDAEQDYIPLNHLAEDQQAEFVAYNSLLSEYGVLGFEYGYSITNPNNIVIWEAQFGDFANGAQIMMDQYISAGETKWQRMTGLIQLLPHGYEGQGPEHSSARIERYLDLCARKNMQVLNCTTPANFFHAIRRQVHREFRIPLVVFTPKKLLRYPGCVSPLSDFGEGTRFQEVIDDPVADPSKVKKVLVCTGKIYYDLLEEKQKSNRDDVAIVRIEQLYPLPVDQLRALIKRYKKAGVTWNWVQEEPRNMGAWNYVLRVITEIDLKVICRKPSPSPASGYYKQHAAELEAILDEAFDRVSEKAAPVTK